MCSFTIITIFSFHVYFFCLFSLLINNFFQTKTQEVQTVKVKLDKDSKSVSMKVQPIDLLLSQLPSFLVNIFLFNKVLTDSLQKLDS